MSKLWLVLTLWLAAVPLTWASGSEASASAASEAQAVVIQANGDTQDVQRAFHLALNMHEVLAQAKFEIVVYGASVKLLTAFSDEVPLIQKVLDDGIRIIACGRSLKAAGLKESDLAPGVSAVPFGAVHIVNRQKQGWQYIKG